MNAMDESSEADQESSVKFIRKLRKKLRQIERLEKGQRELTDEEKIKLSCKHDIRSKLHVLLSTLSEANVSFDSIASDSMDEAVKEYQAEEHGAGGEDQATCVQQDITDHKPVSFGITTKGKPDASSEYVPHKIKDSLTPSAPSEEEITTVRDKAGKGKKTQPLKSLLRRQWRNSTFCVTELVGHNDTVCAVDVDEKWAVSGSRDTTVKLWNLDTREEIRNMGGHGGQITSVILLSVDSSDALRKDLDRSTIETFTDIEEKQHDNEKFVISGSTDCTVRLWLLPQGLSIKSLYNYNPVSALHYASDRKYLFVGSSSGNLTVYNVCTSAQIYSSTVHASQITKLKCKGKRLITSSADGCIKVWKILSGNERKKKAENLRFSNLEFEVASDEFDISVEHMFENHEQYMPERQIHTFLTYSDQIYFGDDGANIKIWDHESGNLTKMRNHKPGIPGITDNLCEVDDVLLSSSYDLDTGCGSLNLRSLHAECHGAYLASFCHVDVPRLACLAMATSQNNHHLVTGGQKLLVWKLVKPGESISDNQLDKMSFLIKGQNLIEMTKPATDSDAPSEGETTDDDEEGKWFWQRKKAKPDKASTKSSDGKDESSGEEEESETSHKWEETSSMNKSSFSIWDWCTLL